MKLSSEPRPCLPPPDPTSQHKDIHPPPQHQASSSPHPHTERCPAQVSYRLAGGQSAPFTRQSMEATSGSPSLGMLPPAEIFSVSAGGHGGTRNHWIPDSRRWSGQGLAPPGKSLGFSSAARVIGKPEVHGLGRAGCWRRRTTGPPPHGPSSSSVPPGSAGGRGLSLLLGP